MEDEIIDLRLENFIYKKIHLQLAAFFGGPLAIVYILAENFRQLGHPEKIRKTWTIGLVLCILFIFGIIMIQLTMKTPSFLTSLISILIGTAIMQSWQGDDIQLHVAHGGNVYPVWRALLIGVISLVITIVFIVFLLLFLNKMFGVNLPQNNQ